MDTLATNGHNFKVLRSFRVPCPVVCSVRAEGRLVFGVLSL